MPFQEVYLHRFLVAGEDTLNLAPRDDTFLVILLVAFQCFALCLSMYILFKSFRNCQVLRREPGNEQPKEEEEEEEEEIALLQVLVHDQQPSAPSPPLTPRLSRDNAKRETCTICLGEYAKGEEVRFMPSCKHLFHKACIEGSSFCPICAKIVTFPIHVGMGDRLQN